MSTSIFETSGTLPRGRHRLSREEVADSQRMRIMGALVELMAESGYAGATIGDVAARASVSRSAFYKYFADKEACLFAAYDTFAETLLVRMASRLTDDSGWYDMVGAISTEYLQTLEDDPVSARAFLVEMDAAGDEARAKQRTTFDQFAEFLKDRHDQFRRDDTSLGPLPESTFLGLVLATRALAGERLLRESAPLLTDLAPEILYWITATIEGAAAARTRFGPP
jgi:AcrR family transcriptional regulator